MSDPHVDTDILIRLLTGDDREKQRAARALFEQVESGTLVLRAPDTVIADAVYVLSSRHTYQKSREEVRELLTPLLRLPGFKVQNRRALLRALEVYSETNLDFGDAMIVATIERTRGDVLYSYDRDFDRFSTFRRKEP
jgi:predicted nucleic acid-binding protein